MIYYLKFLIILSGYGKDVLFISVLSTIGIETQRGEVTNHE